MRKLVLSSLVALLALCEGAPALAQAIGPVQINCNKSVNGAGAVGTVQVLPPIATQTIHYCGFEVTSATASTFQIEFGTGATCGTGTQTVTAASDLSTAGVLTSNNRNVSSARGAGMCVVVGGTGPVHYNIYYTTLP